MRQTQHDAVLRAVVDARVGEERRERVAHEKERTSAIERLPPIRADIEPEGLRDAIPGIVAHVAIRLRAHVDPRQVRRRPVVERGQGAVAVEAPFVIAGVERRLQLAGNIEAEVLAEFRAVAHVDRREEDEVVAAVIACEFRVSRELLPRGDPHAEL